MKEISWEIRERAEELYIVDGLTLEQTAKETGISIQSIKNWSSEEDWPAQRREYRKALGEIKRKTVLLRKKLIEKAFDSLDPQLVYAAARLENVAVKHATKKEDAEPDIDKPSLFLDNLEFMAGFLKDHDPEGLKVLARNFDALIEEFKKAYAQTT